MYGFLGALMESIYKEDMAAEVRRLLNHQKSDLTSTASFEEIYSEEVDIPGLSNRSRRVFSLNHTVP